MKKGCDVTISVQTVRRVMTDYATGFRSCKASVDAKECCKGFVKAALFKYWEKRK